MYFSHKFTQIRFLYICLGFLESHGPLFDLTLISENIFLGFLQLLLNLVYLGPS